MPAPIPEAIKSKVIEQRLLSRSRDSIAKATAVDKFFEDIETQYDAKLGFEAEKDRLNTEIQVLQEKQKRS
jgi:hypothetical protein